MYKSVNLILGGARAMVRIHSPRQIKGFNALHRGLFCMRTKLALLSKTKIEPTERSEGSLLFESPTIRDHEIIHSPRL